MRQLTISIPWKSALGLAALATAVAGCSAAGACEDFVDAVEECQGAPDDYWNQAWCDETVDKGCEDRRYYNCLEDQLDCNDGKASTTPIICRVGADATCPD